MLRGLVVLLQIVLLVTLLRTSYAQHLLANTKNSFSSWLASMSQTGERLAMSGLRDSLQPITENMRRFEAEYVEQVLSSKNSLHQFHQLYCINGDINPYVYGENLRHMCQQISQSQFIPNRI